VARRSIILINTIDEPPPPGTPNGQPRQKMVPLGTRRELVKVFGDRNISPDGSGPEGLGETIGMATLHGPGFIVELPAGGKDDELSQALVSLTDEDFAWPVLSRMCKELHWRMMDPETGRTFG